MNKYLLIFLLIGMATADAATAQTAPPAQIVFKKAAVATFLVGRRQPQMDATMDQTLSCPIGDICTFDPTIAPDAGPTLTRLVDHYLRSRFGRQLASRERIGAAEMQIQLDSAKDTPRTLAMKIGKILNVDAVFIGTVWRFRDRGAIKGIPDSPASVAFAVYLVDTASGVQLWRGIYSGSQQTVMEDLFQAKKQWKLGLKWLSAEELAQHGVQEAFKQFVPTAQPENFAGETP